MARSARFAVLTLGGMFCASLLLAGDAHADSARFLPWKEPTAPPLALNDLFGRPHTLADYRGRVVLLNFWATWCAPCREEMTSMRALQTRLAGRPFVILLVNYGEARARISEFVKRESLAFPILLDPNQEAPRAWRVRVLRSRLSSRCRRCMLRPSWSYRGASGAVSQDLPKQRTGSA